MVNLNKMLKVKEVAGPRGAAWKILSLRVAGARKRYVHPGLSSEPSSEKRVKQRGADIFADSKETEASNKQVTDLMTQLSSEKKKYCAGTPHDLS